MGYPPRASGGRRYAVATGQTADRTQLAETVIAGFSGGDWEQFRAPLASDVVYQETGTGRRVQGVDEYLGLVQGWKQAFPDANGTIRNVVASGDKVVQEVVWEGTQTGEMATPGGTLPASGRRIMVWASLWYAFEGDTIREIHHHLDVMSMLQQLGAVPDGQQGGQGHPGPEDAAGQPTGA